MESEVLQKPTTKKAVDLLGEIKNKGKIVIQREKEEGEKKAEEQWMEKYIKPLMEEYDRETEKEEIVEDELNKVDEIRGQIKEREKQKQELLSKKPWLEESTILENEINRKKSELLNLYDQIKGDKEFLSGLGEKEEKMDSFEGFLEIIEGSEDVGGLREIEKKLKIEQEKIKPDEEKNARNIEKIDKETEELQLSTPEGWIKKEMKF